VQVIENTVTPTFDGVNKILALQNLPQLNLKQYSSILAYYRDTKAHYKIHAKPSITPQNKDNNADFLTQNVHDDGSK